MVRVVLEWNFNHYTRISALEYVDNSEAVPETIEIQISMVFCHVGIFLVILRIMKLLK